MSKKQTPLTALQYSFKNTFLLDKKMKISVAEESVNGRIKVISTSRKISFHQQEEGYFPKLHFPYGFYQQEKCLSKRILFQIDSKSVLISKNGKFFEEMAEKLYTLTRICTKSNKIIANSSNESFHYNSNNGFQLQEKKLGTRNKAFSFKLENGFPRFFKNICVNGRKWFPLARKSFSTCKNKFCP